MEFVIKNTEAEQRVDKYLKRALKNAPISFIYKMFRKKDVKVNGKRTSISYILKEGDVVSVYLKEELLQQFKKEQLLRPVTPDFNIIYEDENILIVDKMKGILVHSTEEEQHITLQNMVLSYLKKKGEFDPDDPSGFIPSPAHRLDRNTSGIVLFGKNYAALNELIKLFRERDKIIKKYTLLVRGITPKAGKIDFPLKKNPETKIVKVTPINKGGKEALTIYERKKVFTKSQLSLVEAELMTGRTHQLRVHFAYSSHPIVGDNNYGDFKLNEYFKDVYSYKSQFLHASYFKFLKLDGILSYLSEKEFRSNLPPKEKSIIESLQSENT